MSNYTPWEDVHDLTSPAHGAASLSCRDWFCAAGAATGLEGVNTVSNAGVTLDVACGNLTCDKFRAEMGWCGHLPQGMVAGGVLLVLRVH